MEEQPVAAPPSTPSPAPLTPIMDVKAPPAVVPEPGVPPTAPAPAASTSPAKQPDEPATPAQAPTKKPAAKGVTTAIIATVIIVLGLAALAVYAYTKTK